MASKPSLRTCVFYNPQDDDESGCVGEFAPGKSESPYCPNCRDRMWFATRQEKQRPGWARRYRSKLRVRSARMDEVTGATHLHTHGKVVSIRSRRRA